jgi:hypothetical protein
MRIATRANRDHQGSLQPEVMVAADFFTVEVWTLKRLTRFVILF